MAATLTRSRTVMTLAQAVGPVVVNVAGLVSGSESTGQEQALFERIDEDGHRRLLSIEYEYEAWDDMGRPDTITVTVEPGDRLNAGS